MDPKTRTVTKESIYLSRKSFTFLDGTSYGGMEREVFDYAITILPDGLYYDSPELTLAGSFNLSSQLFDGGDQSIYKLWDYAIFSGTFDPSDASMQVAFGHTDVSTLSSITWDAWQPMSTRVPPIAGPRESVFLAVRFQGSSTFKLTGMRIYGEKGGFVN
jgi:hypothetical protein